jgi:hypothetical protein
MIRVLLGVVGCFLLNGCAALVPLSSLITTPSSGTPPLQVHEETSVKLAEGNFVLVKTNVVGRSRGFSLLGILTIEPATLNQAMNRLYAAAQLQQGRPQTVAHLVVEQTSSFWILFGIPEVNVRADVVEFQPPPKAPPAPPPEQPTVRGP